LGADRSDDCADGKLGNLRIHQAKSVGLANRTPAAETATDFASAEYRAEVIEGTKRLMLREPRYQHLRGGGPLSTNPAPRPAVQPVYAIGSMEWQRQQKREDGAG
jgi:hypothetical protein